MPLLCVFCGWGLIEADVAILRPGWSGTLGEGAELLGSALVLYAVLAVAVALVLSAAASVAARLVLRRGLSATFGLSAGIGCGLAVVATLYGVWAWHVHMCQYVGSSAIVAAGWVAVALGGVLLAALLTAIARRIGGAPARVLKIGLALTVAAALGVPALRLALRRGPAPDSATGRPNVLLVSVDTLRPDHTSPGGCDIRTPAIQSLADQGAMFENAITHLPLTGPAHASLLSGLLPRGHNSRVNGFPVDSGVPLLGETLRAHGYRTAAFVSGYPLKRYNSGLDRGFDHYDDAVGFFDRFNHLLVMRILNRLELTGGLQRTAAQVTEPCLRWLGANRGRPFFIFLHYFDPHTPYEPPPEFRLYHRPDPMVALYDGEITYADHQLGRVLKQIDEYGLSGRTLVVLVSDHGESLGEHGVFYDHGGDLYDPGLRVAFILRMPGRVPAGARITDAVGLADVAPTVLSLLGIPPTHTVDGMDVSPALKGLALNREWVMAEQYAPESPVDRVAIRNQGWKAIRSAGAGAAEVYGLRDDPGETNNLALAPGGKPAEMLGALAELDQRAAGGRAAKRVVRLDAGQKRRLKSLGYAR